MLDDMQGCTPEELHDIFVKNILLTAGILFVENTSHFRSAKAYLKHFEKISFMQTDRDTSD